MRKSADLITVPFSRFSGSENAGVVPVGQEHSFSCLGHGRIGE